MNPVTEQDLVLHYYGESPRGEEIEKALASDETLAARWAELRAVLELADEGDPVPEPAVGFEDRVWRRLEWKLDETPAPWWRRWFSVSLLAPASAVAALIVLAFVVGRWGPGAPGAPAVPQLDAAVRERILLVDVSQHLGNAEMMLIEVMNAGTQEEELSAVRERAGDLLASNRLYRQVAADENDDPAMSAVLDELDRVLTELRNAPVANGGGRDTSEALAELQESLQQSGTLFKVRVLRNKVQEKARTYQPGSATI